MNTLAQSSYLIIDDSNIIQSATRALLVKLGVPVNNIVSAASAKGAIEACNRHKFDILFIDHNLGTGSTGLHLLEFLRHSGQLKRQALVFIITANDSQDVFLGYSQLEPDGYLIKPIRSEDIIKRVSAGLQQKEFCQALENTYKQDGLNQVKPLFATAPSTLALKLGILHIAGLLCDHQRYDEALAMLSGLLQLHDFLPARIKQVEILLAKQQYPSALEQTERLIADNQFNVRLLNLKTDICVEAKWWEKAEKAMKQVLELHNSSIEQTLNIAWLYIANNRFDFALPYLLQVASLLPYSMWDSPGRRALTLYAALCAVESEKLKTWRADTAWLKLSNSPTSTISKTTQLILKILHAIRQNNKPLIAEHLAQLTLKDITDFETGFLVGLIYRALGESKQLHQLTVHLSQLTTPAKITNSLASLQSLALNTLRIRQPKLAAN